MPNLAVPSEEIISILQTLCQVQFFCESQFILLKNSKTIVYVITGRERRFMEEWFSGMNVGLSCEHGSFFRPYAHPGGTEYVDFVFNGQRKRSSGLTAQVN